jgi:hypothetical protein
MTSSISPAAVTSSLIVKIVFFHIDFRLLRNSSSVLRPRSEPESHKFQYLNESLPLVASLFSFISIISADRRRRENKKASFADDE